jgi:predicted DNA-binding transcriptional regulator YafY
MKPRNTRKIRVARIVYMLATDQVVRADELCLRFRVTKRTFARYIADVREAGFDVVYSEVEDSYRLDSVRFVTSEF